MLEERKYKGFSLIEILIVVGLILILAAVTIVAINPAKHFRDTRNSERMSHVSEILNAVTQYTTEEGSTLADLGIVECGDGDTTIYVEDEGPTDADHVDLAELTPNYIVEIPQDPQEDEDSNETGYTICRTDGGRVQVGTILETEDGPAEEETTVVR